MENESCWTYPIVRFGYTYINTTSKREFLYQNVLLYDSFFKQENINFLSQSSMVWFRGLVWKIIVVDENEPSAGARITRLSSVWSLIRFRAEKISYRNNISLSQVDISLACILVTS